MGAALHCDHLLPTATLSRTVRGSGPGLLVAHGAGGSVGANFGPILDELAIARTVVGVDYPGSGKTPRAHARLHENELADQLVAAAVAEGLHSFAICGFSLGGPIAIRAATRHPDRVTALVLTAAFARANARLRLAAATWRELYESGHHTLLAEFLALAAFSTEFLEALAPADLDATVRELARDVVVGTPEHTDLVERIDVRGDLARIGCPTLVIATTADPLVAPDLQHRLAAGISDAQVVEFDTGHLPMAEKPDEWQRLITTFLAEDAHTVGHANPAQNRR